jgi:hypothetical protein
MTAAITVALGNANNGFCSRGVAFGANFDMSGNIEVSLILFFFFFYFFFFFFILVFPLTSFFFKRTKRIMSG